MKLITFYWRSQHYKIKQGKNCKHLHFYWTRTLKGKGHHSGRRTLPYWWKWVFVFFFFFFWNILEWHWNTKKTNWMNLHDKATTDSLSCEPTLNHSFVLFVEWNWWFNGFLCRFFSGDWFLATSWHCMMQLPSLHKQTLTEVNISNSTFFSNFIQFTLDISPLYSKYSNNSYWIHFTSWKRKQNQENPNSNCGEFAQFCLGSLFCKYTVQIANILISHRQLIILIVFKHENLLFTFFFDNRTTTSSKKSESCTFWFLSVLSLLSVSDNSSCPKSWYPKDHTCPRKLKIKLW